MCHSLREHDRSGCGVRISAEVLLFGSINAGLIFADSEGNVIADKILAIVKSGKIFPADDRVGNGAFCSECSRIENAKEHRSTGKNSHGIVAVLREDCDVERTSQISAHAGDAGCKFEFGSIGIVAVAYQTETGGSENRSGSRSYLYFNRFGDSRARA